MAPSGSLSSEEMGRRRDSTGASCPSRPPSSVLGFRGPRGPPTSQPRTPERAPSPCSGKTRGPLPSGSCRCSLVCGLPWWHLCSWGEACVLHPGSLVALSIHVPCAPAGECLDSGSGTGWPCVDGHMTPVAAQVLQRTWGQEDWSPRCLLGLFSQGGGGGVMARGTDSAGNWMPL